jgi:hypothetical protein
MPKLIKLELIASEDRRGTGNKKDPYRLVEQYHLPNGEFVAEYDPHEDKSYGTINFFNVLRKLKSLKLDEK